MCKLPLIVALATPDDIAGMKIRMMPSTRALDATLRYPW